MADLRVSRREYTCESTPRHRAAEYTCESPPTGRNLGQIRSICPQPPKFSPARCARQAKIEPNDHKSRFLSALPTSNFDLAASVASRRKFWLYGEFCSDFGFDQFAKVRARKSEYPCESEVRAKVEYPCESGATSENPTTTPCTARREEVTTRGLS